VDEDEAERCPMQGLEEVSEISSAVGDEERLVEERAGEGIEVALEVERPETKTAVDRSDREVVVDADEGRVDSAHQSRLTVVPAVFPNDLATCLPRRWRSLELRAKLRCCPRALASRSPCRLRPCSSSNSSITVTSTR
jgi:hypothetical protein